MATKIPIPLLFKQEEKRVIFTGGYMEIYIPIRELERKNTEIVGEKIRTFGIFEMKIWRNEPENPDRETPEFRTRYMYPSKFVTIPSNITYRTIDTGGEDGEKFMVLVYYSKSIFIDNLTVVQRAKDCQDFTMSLFAGFISPVLRYDELVPLSFESAKLNGVKLPINATSLEIVFAAQARYSGNVATPYRLFLKKTENPKQSDLKIIKLQEIPFISDTGFSSIGFQNFDYAVSASAKKARSGETQEENDIEKILKY